MQLLFHKFSHIIFFIYAGLNIVHGQITFSEVMNNPSTNENHDEYLEVYNLSDDVIDLSGWSVADSASQDALVDFGFGMQLNPKRYAVILDGSYTGNSTTYDAIIPDSVLIIQVEGGTIASRLSNSTSKSLFLMNSEMDTIDRYRYVADYPEGYSNEKIDVAGSNDTSNWTQSQIQGGTPGWLNSVTPVARDIGFTTGSLSWTPREYVTRQKTVILNIRLFNFGTESFQDDISLRIFNDANNDSLFNRAEPVIENINSSVDLAAEAYIDFTVNLLFTSAGFYTLVCEMYDIEDSNALNNVYFFQIEVMDDSKELHINEIKFLTDEGEPEWLELHNSSIEPVLLYGWAIADVRDTSRIDSIAHIQAGQYKILASKAGLETLYDIEDSLIIVLTNLPSFNNAEDIIYLLNPLGGWQEQLPYTVDWLEGQEWRLPSLERINIRLEARQARNWGPSTDATGATPAKKNSIFTDPASNLKSKLVIKPNPFSPDGDGQDDYTLIQIDLPTKSARIKVEIYDILGRKVNTLTDNSFSGSQTALTWDGRNDNGRKLPMGIYIVFVQILNDREGLIRELKGTVVVAKAL